MSKMEGIERELRNTKKDILVYIALQALKVSSLARNELSILYEEAECENCKEKIKAILDKMEDV